jgi:membrane associated rhomboid family serine protease
VVVWGLIGASVAASLLARLAGLEPGAFASYPWWNLTSAFVVFARSSELVLVVIALWLFGPTVEDRLGHGRFAGLWLSVGAAAAAASLAAQSPDDPWWPAAGFGAAAGIVGASLALHPKGRMLGAMPVLVGFEFVDVPTWAYALAWTAAAFVLTFEPPAAVAASLAASLAVGVVGALALRRKERLRVEWWGP